MSVQQGYDKWSATYDTDRNFTRDLDQYITQQILGDYAVSTILELGCGTGKNTSFLASLAQQVLAFDFSAGMLVQACTKIQNQNVSFGMMDFTQGWVCAGNSVDLISCNLVLEHIEDLDFIFREANRVLVDGGVFFISELHPFKQYQGIQANFQRGDDSTAIPAVIHHASAFVNAALQNGFTLHHLGEWWHEADDTNATPRLISFVFKKSA